jgi:hypothetical protein
MSKQAVLPFQKGVIFDEAFLADHAGQLMTDAKVALIELVANSYDAAATRVRISWPSDIGNDFSIEDNGTGMSEAEFQKRWRTLGYNRVQEQGRLAQFPPDANVRSKKRQAFGQSGKGRHGAFCFDDQYTVETWKDGHCVAGQVRLTRGGSEPFEFVDFKRTVKDGHGTVIRAVVRRNFVNTDVVRAAIGSKFLVDPEFAIVLNDQSLSLLQLQTVNTTTVRVEGFGEISVSEVDPQESDRTTDLRGITWWVQGRMVGAPSWDGFDRAGAILDGRSAVAKRMSFVVKADILMPVVRADWSGFHASDLTSAIVKAAREHVTSRLSVHLAATRTLRKREVLSETAADLQLLSSVSRRVIGKATEQILSVCPSMTHGDLTRTVQVLAKMEKARTGYDLLSELAACSADDIDRWTEIMRRWTATDAEVVLGELHWRLELIARLQTLINAGRADELHDLQPLFERGLWMFGPEYESVEFRSNRTLATVVAELLGGDPKAASARRPDLVALADRSIGVYAADAYDSNGEVSGISRVLVVELKRAGFTLTRKEVSQPEDYVAELRSRNHVKPTTRFEVFVLGSKIAADAADDRKVGDHTWIRPMAYERLLRRAHARTFNLLSKVKAAFPDVTSDEDVEAVLKDGPVLFTEAETAK